MQTSPTNKLYPLSHPEIVDILRGMKQEGLKVKLDTVGSALLQDAKLVYKGRGAIAKVDIGAIAPYVDFVNVPLDGARQESIAQFRRGRPNLFSETRAMLVPYVMPVWHLGIIQSPILPI